MKSISIILSRAQMGLEAHLVTVEIHISSGLPKFNIVGLPATTIKESRDRVRSAIINSQFCFPAKRITVNLGPADLPKEGGQFDLPIALGILAASRQISSALLLSHEFMGELSLDGDLRPFKGVLSCAIASREAGHFLVLPETNAHEASLVSQAKILSAKHLLGVCAHLNGKENLPLKNTSILSLNQENLASDRHHSHFNSKSIDKTTHDLSQVIGQHHAKRALEIAAVGGLNLLMLGPPGTGKSLIASCLPGILPPLTEEQALEVASIYSSEGHFSSDEFWIRPFRSPHHTCSSVSIVGGGRLPKPGEISLAHQGVLFLDELPEFDRRVLESLRTPMETGQVIIARANYKLSFPANFQFICAMNPCPCSYLGDEDIACRCSDRQIQHYQGKISGPLLDRIDLFVKLKRLKHLGYGESLESESSAVVYKRVCQAHTRLSNTLMRLTQTKKLWRNLSLKQLQEICTMDTATQNILFQASEKFKLSPRGCHRLLRVAITIALLEKSTILEKSIKVEKKHLTEALSFRETFSVAFKESISI